MNFDLRQVGAHLHTLLYAGFSRVPCENIGKMDLVRLADLPLVLVAGPRIAGRTYTSLRAFQRHLVEQDWPSLAEIYPRPMQWFYAYNLFFWARYCKVLPALLREPQRCLLAEIYLRYICQIDTYLDSFDSRALSTNFIAQIENRPEIEAIRLELHSRVAATFETDPDGQVFLAFMQAYLDNNLLAFGRWMESEGMSLEEIQAYKEITTGKLYATWARMLGLLYRVPGDLAENAARIFSLYGLATQVVDDISDAKQDYLVHSPNVFLGIASQNPGEYGRLIAHIGKMKGKYMHWPWLKKHLPGSYEQAIGRIRFYVNEMQAITCQKPLTGELSSMVARLISVVGYERVRL